VRIPYLSHAEYWYTPAKDETTPDHRVHRGRRAAFRQDELAATEGRVVQDLIAIYKAVGGGWAEDAKQPETFTVGAGPD